MKRFAPRRPRSMAPAEQIRAALELAILERQVAWRAELELATPDWARLLSLHLQLSELEHVEGALEELFA